MIDSFFNDNIRDYFKNIRELLYEVDGRSDLPPEDLLDFKEVEIMRGGKIDNPESNENSLIKLLPNKSVWRFIEYRKGLLDNSSDQKNYNNDFLKFPINTTEISEEIEIDWYFYKYSFLDEKDIYIQNNADFISARNYLMRRSDFLYMTIYSKFVSISDNFQKCLKKGRKEFQFNKKVDEEIILQHFIKHYNDILNTNDKQLKIFEYVKLTKQVADLFTKILIEYLTVKLKNLHPENDTLYVAQPQGISVNGNIEKKIVVELPEDFSLIEQSINSEALDIRETAVLFYYLRKHHATIEYSDKSYAKLVHYLSGYSAENLRKRSGFGNIIKIFNEKRGGVEKSNLKNVKHLLEKIISDIDKEIEK